MRLFPKFKQSGILLIFILFLSYFSLSSSLGTVYFPRSSLIDDLNHSSFSSETSAQPPQVLRVLDLIWVWNDPLSFDSLINYSTPASFVFDTLVSYDFETEVLIPSLAENWVVTNDSIRWTFFLRDDVWFHDGSKFNASVVKFNFDRLIDPTHPAYSASAMTQSPMTLMSIIPLESVEVLSEFSVMFTFFKPFASFIELYASVFHILSPNSFHQGVLSYPIGTGPYIFTQSAIEADKIVISLTRNSNYFQGLPPFEKVVYTAFNTYEDYLDAILAEEGDISAKEGRLSGVDAIGDNHEYWNISRKGSDSFFLGWLNHQREEFKNQKVRLALNYAVDKETYIQDIDYREGIPLLNIFPQFLLYRDDSVSGYPYNVTKANELLDEAGYPRGADNYRFSLEITAPGDSSRADYLVDYLDAIGINCTIVVLPWEEDGVDDFSDRFYTGDYEMMLVGWAGIRDPILMNLFLHSNGTLNTFGYSNSTIDSLFELSNESPVRQEREYYFKLIQVIAHLDAPFLLLIETPNYYPLAYHVQSFVKKHKNGLIGFSFSPSVNVSLSSYSDVLISSKPIYFPFADAIIAQSDSQALSIDLTMAHDLNAILPSFKGTGKFYQVSIKQKGVNYRFRCYYDHSEITDLSLDQFYQYDPSSHSWSLLMISSSNTSLRYVEVELSTGSHILSLGKQIAFVTYKLVPIISFLFGSVLLFALLTIFYNQLKINQFKRRYNI
ncbi:MAG: ABC transporter substrate-binding protein [Candidatus Hodarchaeota archaeon]